MIRMSFVAACALTAFSTLPAQAQRPAAKTVWPDEGPAKWAPRPTASDISANDLRTRLYQFADDSMQGRRIGERGNYKGTAYIASEFTRMGLKPAGENGTYFQTMPFGPLGFVAANSSLTVGGAALALQKDWIPLAPAANNGLGRSIDLTNVPVVYGGRWANRAPLDPAAFRGKIVVFDGAPGGGGRGPAAMRSCADLPDRFGARAAAHSDSITNAGRGGRGRGNTRDTRIQDAGAAGVLFIDLDSMSQATIGAAFATRGAMEPAANPAPGGGVISEAAAQRLFGKSVAQLVVGEVGQPVSAHWTQEWSMSKTPARNVIAIMPGTDPARAGEYVLVSAHNDHNGVNARAVDHDSLRAVNWVTRRQGANDPACIPTPEQQHKIDSIIAHARSVRPPRRDSIMNGADDDGSGTVILLEIAQKFASEKPARSIIFVSHNGEEGGLLGSRWFTDHPTIPLDKIVAAHNMDMEAKGRVDYVKFGGPNSIQTLGSRRLSPEFGDIIDSVNAVRAVPMAVDKSWDVFENPMNRFCRSDQVNYVRHDVPVTYFSTGYAPDYHQPTDEPAYADYDHMARVGNFIHDVMWAISQRQDRPSIAGPDPRYPSCAR